MRLLSLILLFFFLITPLAQAGTAIDYDDANCQGAWLMDVDEDPIRDDSQNTNTGALKGAGEPNFATASPPDTYSTGYYDFDGTDDRINCGSDTSLDSLSVFSYIFWCRFGAVISSSKYFLVKQVSSDTSAAGNLFWHFESAGTDRIEFQANTNSTTGASNYNTTIDDGGGWHNLVATYNDGGDRKVDIYEDGVEVSYNTQQAAAGTLTDNSNSSLILGGRSFDDNRNFNGDLDEVAVFDRIIDSTEINDIIDNGLAPSGGTVVKTIQGLAVSSVKTIQGLAKASVKTFQGLAMP